jgi:hypothetical protein
MLSAANPDGYLCSDGRRTPEDLERADHVQLVDTIENDQIDEQTEASLSGIRSARAVRREPFARYRSSPAAGSAVMSLDASQGRERRRWLASRRKVPEQLGCRF